MRLHICLALQRTALKTGRGITVMILRRFARGHSYSTGRRFAMLLCCRKLMYSNTSPPTDLAGLLRTVHFNPDKLWDDAFDRHHSLAKIIVNGR